MDFYSCGGKSCERNVKEGKKFEQQRNEAVCNDCTGCHHMTPRHLRDEERRKKPTSKKRNFGEKNPNQCLMVVNIKQR